MIEITLSNIKLILGAREIFKDLVWEIQRDQRIGLIGPNGAGKTSLFKLITREYITEPGGSIVFAKGVTVGYLPQQPEFDPDQNVFQCALDGNPRVCQIRADLLQVETAFSDPMVYANEKALSRNLDRQHALLEEYQGVGGDQYEERVKEVLVKLGLPEEQFAKTMAELSGGQKKLVGLARLLLLKPGVLLLDEPDNHLDLDGKVYLENLITSYPGTVVIISHDRYLLDRITTHITELEDGKLTTYEGNFSEFMLDKQIRMARQEELYSIQQKSIARIEMAIKRYSIWTKVYDNEKFARQARSIQKRLDKMDRLDRPVLERKRMDLKLSGWRGSSKVMEFKAVTKKYEEQTVLREVDLLIRHGEHVGVIGKNGSGKSVLLRLALEFEKPDDGDVVLGPSIRTAWYAQEHETLDQTMTVMDTVRRKMAISESRAVSFLNRFLFTYRMTSQFVSELSGGERSRLQLALIMLSNANFLLLDEPTNNLDIASAEVLENAISEFDGTVLVVSHDRYFLDQVVDRLLVVEDGGIREFSGGYSEFLQKNSIISRRLD
jgi:ATP-binding cassette subfamily F protein 3